MSVLMTVDSVADGASRLVRFDPGDAALDQRRAILASYRVHDRDEYFDRVQVEIDRSDIDGIIVRTPAEPKLTKVRP